MQTIVGNIRISIISEINAFLLCFKLMLIVFVFDALQENQENFKVTDTESDIWKAYVDFLDEMVVDGFFTTIQCSLKFMLDNTEIKAELAPLFEARLELYQTDMVFTPNLDPGAADGFYDLIDSLVGDVYKQSAKIPRLAKHCGQEHYQVCCNSQILIKF